MNMKRLWDRIRVKKMSEGKNCGDCVHTRSCHMVRLIADNIGFVVGLESFYPHDKISEAVKWSISMANFCRYYESRDSTKKSDENG